MRDTERERERQRHRQREKQAPCREPDEGLNPRTLRSRPESKADTHPLSYPGAPEALLYLFILKIFLFIHENTQKGERERQRHRQREKQAPCRDPDVGLDPRSPGSRPGPKAALNP